MAAQSMKRPSVPSSSQVPDHGSGYGEARVEGAKNHWERTGSLKELTICTYNVRTLLSEPKLHELEKELDHITWDILGLCEVRRLELKSGHMLYTRGKDNSSTGGVGFLIRKDLASNVVSYKNQSDRVAQVIIKISKRQTLKIIQSYLPTISYPDEDVDAVYEEINELLNQDKANHTIIMGDFNA
ncbi:craniofacial development protein 2-like [Amphiura filiformis]|uniref:craniofacial development protein 2-like n=1 Tax=Amphiura filiformis TaxID=82378 RepID=UPI003B210360